MASLALSRNAPFEVAQDTAPMGEHPQQSDNYFDWAADETFAPLTNEPCDLAIINSCEKFACAPASSTLDIPSTHLDPSPSLAQRVITAVLEINHRLLKASNTATAVVKSLVDKVVPSGVSILSSFLPLGRLIDAAADAGTRCATFLGSLLVRGGINVFTLGIPHFLEAGRTYNAVRGGVGEINPHITAAELAARNYLELVSDRKLTGPLTEFLETRLALRNARLEGDVNKITALAERLTEIAYAHKENSQFRALNDILSESNSLLRGNAAFRQKLAVDTAEQIIRRVEGYYRENFLGSSDAISVPETKWFGLAHDKDARDRLRHEIAERLTYAYKEALSAPETTKILEEINAELASAFGVWRKCAVAGAFMGLRLLPVPDVEGVDWGDMWGDITTEYATGAATTELSEQIGKIITDKTASGAVSIDAAEILTQLRDSGVRPEGELVRKVLAQYGVFTDPVSIYRHGFFIQLTPEEIREYATSKLEGAVENSAGMPADVYYNDPDSDFAYNQARQRLLPDEATPLAELSRRLGRVSSTPISAADQEMINVWIDSVAAPEDSAVSQTFTSQSAEPNFIQPPLEIITPKMNSTIQCHSPTIIDIDAATSQARASFDANLARELDASQFASRWGLAGKELDIFRSSELSSVYLNESGMGEAVGIFRQLAKLESGVHFDRLNEMFISDTGADLRIMDNRSEQMRDLVGNISAALVQDGIEPGSSAWREFFKAAEADLSNTWMSWHEGIGASNAQVDADSSSIKWNFFPTAGEYLNAGTWAVGKGVGAALSYGAATLGAASSAISSWWASTVVAQFVSSAFDKLSLIANVARKFF